MPSQGNVAQNVIHAYDKETKLLDSIKSKTALKHPSAPARQCESNPLNTAHVPSIMQCCRVSSSRHAIPSHPVHPSIYMQILAP